MAADVRWYLRSDGRWAHTQSSHVDLKPCSLQYEALDGGSEADVVAGVHVEHRAVAAIGHATDTEHYHEGSDRSDDDEDEEFFFVDQEMRAQTLLVEAQLSQVDAFWQLAAEAREDAGLGPIWSTEAPLLRSIATEEICTFN